MKTKKETFCPLFSGFYGTIYEPDLENEVYNINEERKMNDLTYEISDCDIEFDNSGYQKEVAEQFCSEVESALNKLGFEASIDFQSVVSPREYNFANDSINIEIEFNWRKVKAYIAENFENFSEHIKEKYTSCSGFISHHSSESGDWLNDFSDEYWLNDSHKIGAILEFILLNEEVNSEYFVDSYVSEHCLNITELETAMFGADYRAKDEEIEANIVERVWKLGGRLWHHIEGRIQFELNDSMFVVLVDSGEITWSNKYGKCELI